MNRKEAREKTVQVLFQVAVSGTDLNEAIEHVLDDQEMDPFMDDLITQTITHLDAIDETIKPYLVNWHFDRVGNIEKTILRIAVSELLYVKETPQKVVLNEAVELSKTFGDEKTRKFVNGVLGKFLTQINN